MWAAQELVLMAFIKLDFELKYLAEVPGGHQWRSSTSA